MLQLISPVETIPTKKTMVQSGVCTRECCVKLTSRVILVHRALRGISWVYDTRLLERSFADLSTLDSSHSNGPLLLLWEPPSLDSRIANQSGLLSIMNKPDESQNTFLHTQSINNPDLVLRIVIEAKAKSEIRDMLDQNGISERTIFPGLPGLCDWLRRYYGKAW